MPILRTHQSAGTSKHSLSSRWIVLYLLLLCSTVITMANQKLGRVDPTSYSNPDELPITDIGLQLDVDFNQKVLKGLAELAVTRKAPDAFNLILDAKDLKISKVSLKSSGAELPFRLGDSYKTFGSPLEIQLPKEDNSSTFTVIINYETSPSASALQWLTPEQTLGKKEPYMFSQCQAIHARSIVPCQDTPSVKIRYTADITAPKQLTTLMSALHVGEPTTFDAKRNVSKFEQPIPIPSYLLAIVVGRISSIKLGPRCSVWSEPEGLQKAADEFSDTEKTLDAAISIAGDYVWKVYDLLVMPPSFPFGGMENPCLTFVTPTVLAGDKSLVDVVAHEVSHSWSGNLVTTATFEHFWLNEGFTMFLERKIRGKLLGSKERHFDAIQGLATLRETVNTLGADNPYTKLVVNLTDTDPDDAFSTIPYEKGHTFLFYLEELVGGEDEMNPFLKSYFSHFKNQSITTDEFKNYFLTFFKDKPQTKKIDWDTWLLTTGMPAVIPEYDTSLTDACSRLSEAWLVGPAGRSTNDFTALSSNQIILFLDRLLAAKTTLSPDSINRMAELYDFNESGNCEIRFRWTRLGLHAHMKEFIPKALQFVNEQGRMKYVRPIYRDLYDWEESREGAIENYHKNKNAMMFVLSNQLLKDLHISQ